MAESTREIYHRMKNHLSMVASLINLQKAHLTSKEAIDSLEKLRVRVQSIALVHQNLYKGQDPNRLNMADFIKDLLHSMRFALGRPLDDTKLNIDVENFCTDIDTSFPLCLIITELVTNALQYSFNGNSGSVSLILKREKDNQIIFSISNSGPPLPEDIDLNNPVTFGFQLVKGLTEQLEGEISILDRENSTIEIRIPDGPCRPEY
jgi:two-component sensor histidine kinase